MKTLAPQSRNVHASIGIEPRLNFVSERNQPHVKCVTIRNDRTVSVTIRSRPNLKHCRTGQRKADARCIPRPTAHRIRCRHPGTVRHVPVPPRTSFTRSLLSPPFSFSWGLSGFSETWGLPGFSETWGDSLVFLREDMRRLNFHPRARSSSNQLSYQDCDRTNFVSDICSARGPKTETWGTQVSYYIRRSHPNFARSVVWRRSSPNISIRTHISARRDRIRSPMRSPSVSSLMADFLPSLSTLNPAPAGWSG